MSDFLDFNFSQWPEEDIYEAGWSTTRNSSARERFYSLVGNVPNKPTTPEILSAISQMRKLHNLKEAIILGIRYLEHRKVQLQNISRDIEIRMKNIGPYGDKTVNRTMTTRVFAATENIKRLHNEREEVIRRLQETEDQLRGLRRELRDIDRSVNSLMRRLGGIGDKEDVDGAVAKRIQDMLQ